MPKSLAIVEHPGAPIGAHRYYMLHLAAELLARGVRVYVGSAGGGLGASADAAALHIDATEVPAEFHALAALYPFCVNSGVHSISKRVFSTGLLTQGEDYDGMVIVKTHRNNAGRSDERLGDGCRYSYSVCNVRDVPRDVWWNPDLVVERFLPERVGNEYALRMWKFLYSAETLTRAFSYSAVVKGRSVRRREELNPSEVPDEVREVRKRMCVDFGKIDYVMHEGRAVALDVNTTPTVSRNPRDGEALDARVKLFADALQERLEQ